jgi:dihydropteroate synthase
MRKVYSWKCGTRELVLGRRTLVMAILNVTPDSFSDGGSYTDADEAADYALTMEAEGADIIDIGGESTRPGAEPVAEAEEIRRTVHVIEKIRAHSDISISIDTMKSSVARRAMEAGADIINDVSAFGADEKMAVTAAETGAGVVLMHMKGSPRTMQNNPIYADVVGEVGAYLQTRIDAAVEHGVGRDRLVIDPGLGFGKTTDHNLSLLRGLTQLAECGVPLLVGASRKQFIGRLTGKENPHDRLAGSLGAAAWAAAQGAHILRVHDVIQTCDVCRIMDTLRNGDT